MENLVRYNYDFDNQELNKYINNINATIDNNQNGFVNLCTTIHLLDEFCKLNKGYNLFILLANFGLCRRTINKLLKCFSKYMFIDQAGAGSFINPSLSLFNSSKLIELLSVPITQLYGDMERDLLKPSMSFREIRSYVKSLKTSKNQNVEVCEDTINVESDFDIDINNSNIEDSNEFYSPKKHYEFEFFKACTKEQLLTIVWSLQFEYERMLKCNDKKQKICKK